MVIMMRGQRCLCTLEVRSTIMMTTEISSFQISRLGLEMLLHIRASTMMMQILYFQISRLGLEMFVNVRRSISNDGNDISRASTMMAKMQMLYFYPTSQTMTNHVHLLQRQYCFMLHTTNKYKKFQENCNKRQKILCFCIF